MSKKDEVAPRFFTHRGDEAFMPSAALAKQLPEHVRGSVVAGQTIQADENPDPDVFVEVFPDV